MMSISTTSSAEPLLSRAASISSSPCSLLPSCPFFSQQIFQHHPPCVRQCSMPRSHSHQDNFPLSSCDSHLMVLSEKIGVEICHIQKGSGWTGSHLSSPAWDLLSSGSLFLPTESPSLQLSEALVLSCFPRDLNPSSPMTAAGKSGDLSGY